MVNLFKKFALASFLCIVTCTRKSIKILRSYICICHLRNRRTTDRFCTLLNMVIQCVSIHRLFDMFMIIRTLFW